MGKTLGNAQLWDFSKETLAKAFTLKSGPATSQYSGYRKVPCIEPPQILSVFLQYFVKFSEYIEMLLFV